MVERQHRSLGCAHARCRLREGVPCPARPAHPEHGGARVTHGKPLLYVALAARKSGYSLYLLGPYLDPALARWLADAFARAGKRLDMGKSCLRFKKLDDLPLDAIGELVGKMSVAAYLKRYELGLGMRTAKKAAQPAQKKVSKKRTPARKTR